MSQMNPSEDIRSVTDLKRNTREILGHLHATGRPVILTVNGRADSVLLDVRVYVELLQAGNLAKLIAPAEQDVESGRTRPARDFVKEFKRTKEYGVDITACNMQDYRVETKVASDGSLTIKGLPFQAGDTVEVIIRSHKHGEPKSPCYPLRGKPIRYTDPFGSVAEEDWEAMR